MAAEQRELDRAARRAEALAVYGNACACCGSIDQDSLVLVVLQADTRLKLLPTTAPSYQAFTRNPPPNSDARCGNCFATFNATGSCTHEVEPTP